MGVVFSSTKPLLPPFESFTRWQVSHILDLMKKFMKRQKCYGYNIDKDLFEKLFAVPPASIQASLLEDKGSGEGEEKGLSANSSAPNVLALWALFGGKSGEYDVKANMLDICAGIIVVCNSPFKKKMKALFELFDFEEGGLLDRRNLSTMVKACKSGMSKMTGEAESRDVDCDEFIFHNWKPLDAIIKVKQCDVEKFTAFACICKDVVHLFSRFRTVVEQNPDTDFSVSTRTGDLGALAHKGKRDKVGIKQLKNDQKTVKNLKHLFDQLDSEGQGLVTIENIRKRNFQKSSDANLFRDVVVMLQDVPLTTRDRENKEVPTSISFKELLLNYAFKDCTFQEKDQLEKWVPLQVTEEVILKIQRIFDRLDEDFKGKVKLSVCIDALRETDFKNFISEMPPVPFLPPGKKKEDPLTFKELCYVLFAASHKPQHKKIMPNIKNSKLLSDSQQKDLLALFNKYDTEGHGYVPLTKLKRSMQENSVTSGLNLTDKEISAMFKDVEVDQAGNVSLHAFQFFYRDVWDSYINFDIDCLKTSFHDSSSGIDDRRGSANDLAKHSKAVMHPLNQGINSHLSEEEKNAQDAADTKSEVFIDC